MKKKNFKYYFETFYIYKVKNSNETELYYEKSINFYY